MASKKSSTSILTHFDYEILSQTERQIVLQRTGEIRERLQRSAQDIWEIGQRLAEVRATLKHGQFDAWIKAEFGWSRRTAYNFINVYETFQERANLAQIEIATSALYLLAAPSTPVEIREASLREARGGKKITHKDLRDRLEQDRPVPTQAQTVSAKPEIISLIPQSSSEHQQTTDQRIRGSKRPETGQTGQTGQARHSAIDVASQMIPDALPSGSKSSRTKSSGSKSSDSKLSSSIPPIVKGHWYRLGQRHLIFCGDTAAPAFYSTLLDAEFALAATGSDWDHDWLIEATRSVMILPETELRDGMVEQLITLFSQPQETVIFPWLPQPDLLAIAHRLDRTVIAGDLSPERCYRAIAATGLSVQEIA